MDLLLSISLSVCLCLSPSLSPISLSLNRCNLSISQSHPDYFAFDIANIAGSYKLQMENPYQRAVCLKLLTLVAENITLKFGYFHHDPSPSSSSSAGLPTSASVSVGVCAIPLRQCVLKIPFERLSEHDQTVYRNLEVIIRAAEDSSLAKELFQKFDSDGSGALDLDELQLLVTHFSPAIEAVTLEEVSPE
jgi:hypothetical protein